MVSVIIPNYNKSKYVKETILSVLNQDYKDWECIIIDDFSSDNSVSVISNLIKNEKRFHLMKNSSNYGANFSRNIGLKKSKGDFVMFLDADDILSPNCLSIRLDKLLFENDLDFGVFPIGTFHNNIGDNEFVWNNFSGVHLDRFLYHDLPWLICSVIWKKEFLDNLGGFSEDFHRMQDVEFHSRVLIQSNPIYKTFDSLNPDCFYRISNQRISDFFIFCRNDINAKIMFVNKFSNILIEENTNKLKLLSGTIFESYNLIFNYLNKGLIDINEYNELLIYISNSKIIINRNIFSKISKFLYIKLRKNNIFFIGMNKVFKIYF
jgi:glycosyltransferase involved in cell wall biosynthesis